jgi:hypothetical protein
MNTIFIHGHPASDLELIGDSYYLFETGEYVGDIKTGVGTGK